MADISTHQQLDQMITGYWISQAIYAAAKFGIADHLKDGPKTVGELAAATSTKPDALYRLLRALASVGIFTEGESRRFSLTPLAEPLRSEVAGLVGMLGQVIESRLAENLVEGNLPGADAVVNLYPGTELLVAGHERQGTLRPRNIAPQRLSQGRQRETT